LNIVLADIADVYMQRDRQRIKTNAPITEQEKRTSNAMMPQLIHLVRFAVALLYFRPDIRSTCWTQQASTRHMFLILIWTVFGAVCSELLLEKQQVNNDTDMSTSPTHKASEPVASDADTDSDTDSEIATPQDNLCTLLEMVHDQLGEMNICHVGKGKSILIH
jgi:hypothetical protein